MSVHSIKSRSVQKSQTRDRILARTKSLCARRGFLHTTTIDVAKAARVSHGSVFAHFPTREDLMATVVSEMAREITDALHASVSAGASLGDVLAAHVECLAERESEIRWLLLETPLLPKGFHSAWVGLQSAVSQHISQAAEREMAAGGIRVMPLHLLFNTWVGLVHHYIINKELYAPGGSVLRRHGRVLLKHFLGLISTSETNQRKEKG